MSESPQPAPGYGHAAAPPYGEPPPGGQHQPPPHASPHGAPSAPYAAPPPDGSSGGGGGGYQTPYAAPARRKRRSRVVAPVRSSFPPGTYPKVELQKSLSSSYNQSFKGLENRIGCVDSFKLFGRKARKLFSCFTS